jgi:cyclopropane fatty-acyl-phospholipid synthase-like methyltransferase
MMQHWPDNLNWREWVERFDRMQDRYLVARNERFQVIVRTVRAVRPEPRRILDLGCGTGSLSEVVLDAFPECTLIGLDLDESLLALAESRLGRFGQRAILICDDLRKDHWVHSVGQFDAAVSATALHWLSAENLARLYGRLAGVLNPGGIFLNADHVASEHPAIQVVWHEEKARQLAAEDHSKADTWPEFWKAYATALGADANTMGGNVVGAWEGVEEQLFLW